MTSNLELGVRTSSVVKRNARSRDFDFLLYECRLVFRSESDRQRDPHGNLRVPIQGR